MGAGRLSLGVAGSVAVALAVALPEAGVTGLAETSTGAVKGDSVGTPAESVASADALLVGPGLDDGDETAKLLEAVIPLLGTDTTVVLDAYALGALAQIDSRLQLSGRLVLTPNPGEAKELLDAGVGSSVEEHAEASVEIARRYGAVVSFQGLVADTDGNTWLASTGHGGLATSGSGDVLAGSVTGLVARGETLPQAACWATHLHAVAGDRLELVEGPSDAAALKVLAARSGRDLGAQGVQIVSMGGVTDIGHHLRRLGSTGRRVTVAGLCDAGEERFFRRALGKEGYAATTRGEMTRHGFFMCDPDLEDELLKALGVETVERVLEREGELELFRRFQQQPTQRRRPTLAQMHRFAGTRSGRKVRLAAAMAQALEPDDVPRPLNDLLQFVSPAD